MNINTGFKIIKYKKITLKIIIFIFSCFIIKYLIKKNILNKRELHRNNHINDNDNNYNKYNINNWITFNITNIKYSFSFVFNIVKIEYYIGFYDRNNNIIVPSDLSLHNNLHVICHFEETKNKAKVNSLANIYKNKYFYCIEFFNFNDIINVGIKLYILKNNKYTNYYNINFIINMTINYNDLIYQNDCLFNPFLINNEYNSLYKRIDDKSMNKTLKLKKSYIEYPFYLIKSIVSLKNNQWLFKNIYNYYFCFCKGQNCLNSTIPDDCKYNFYLYIIDNTMIHIFN